MLATPSRDARVADPDAFAFEPKWDGFGAFVRVDLHGVEVTSRRGRSLSAAFPEFLTAPTIGGRSVLLDGELVCFDAAGRPDWDRLRHRSLYGSRSAPEAARLAPACFVAFDVLELDGERLVDRQWSDRRRILEALGLSERHWRTTPVGVGLREGTAVWRFTI